MNEHTNLNESIPADLPMSVPLKGHENYFNEFSMDATEVMDLLGIKRSRLRQISGQELRVGRKRVERYIKPFYRPEDVESYQQWTRQTATHKKSSDALQNAAKELSDMKSHLATAVSQDVTRESRHLYKLLTDSAHSQRETRTKLLLELDRKFSDLSLTIGQIRNSVNDKVSALNLRLQKIADELAQVSRSSEIMKELSLETSETSTQNNHHLRQLELKTESMEALLEKLYDHSEKTSERLSSLEMSVNTPTDPRPPRTRHHPGLIKRKSHLVKSQNQIQGSRPAKPTRCRSSSSISRRIIHKRESS